MLDGLSFYTQGVAACRQHASSFQTRTWDSITQHESLLP